MGECTEKESSLLNFSGRPLQLVYCSDCAWESSPEMNCCQLQWLLCLGSPSRIPHPSQIQVIIKWPVQPSALLHKKHRQKRVYDAWVCVQQLRLDHKIAVCCPSPSCFPFMASSLLSACILQGLTTFSGPAHVIVCKPLLHAFFSNAFNKSISRALQVLLYKSIIIQNFYTIIGGLSIQVALIGMRNIPLLMDTWIVCRWSLKIFTLTTALLNSGLVDCTSS